MINKITKKELEIIDWFREHYGPIIYSNNNNINYDRVVPVEDILVEWESAKSDHLEKLLGGELILSKEICFEKDLDELSDDLFSCQNDNYVFEKEWERFLNKLCYFEYEFMEVKRLMYPENLLTNTYHGDSFNLHLPDGKIMRINKGCKVSRMLGKIAHKFNLSGLEEYRNMISRVIGQKKIHGKLCLSIHPLDYITLSENNYDWDTCFQWSSCGCHRQATIENMNCKNVIVAYLDGEEPYYVGNDNDTWHNKKWRSLFIVDKNAIIAVKGYPYRNTNLDKAVMNWLIELAKENLGWEYEEPFYHNFQLEQSIELDYLLSEGIESFRINVITSDNLYNDIGSSENNLITIKKNLKKEDFKYYNRLNIEYGGPSQCIYCGKIYPTLLDESFLLCEDCQIVSVCSHCGNYIYDDYDMYYLDDDILLCERCYCNCTHECDICGENHYVYNMTQVHILPPENRNQEFMKEMSLKNPDTYRRYPSSIGICDFKDGDKIEYIRFNRRDSEINVCRSEIEKWKKLYLLPDKNIHIRSCDWDYYSFIYWDELNEEGQKLYEEYYLDYLEHSQLYTIIPSRIENSNDLSRVF